MRRIFKNKRGFTLMELVVVIAIIVVLTAIAIPVFGNVVSNNKLKALKTQAENIYLIAEQVNKNIDNGITVIGVHFTTTQLALNNLLPSDKQITSTIEDSAWAALEADGNYIAVNENKVIAVYVIIDGVKVKWNSTGYVSS